MAPPRRRTLGEDDEMDITTGYDDEKGRLVARDPSVDPYSPDSSPSSSHRSHSAYDSMLHGRSPPRRLFAHSSVFYRIPNRTARWACIALMSTVVIFILSLIRMSQLSAERVAKMGKEHGPAPWESFNFLSRYYGGLRTLTTHADNTPEFPNSDENPQITIEVDETLSKAGNIPLSKVFDPYPDYSSADYVKKWGKVEQCYLDEDNTIPVPKIQGYEGTTKGFPDPVIGSYDVVGIRNTICYDRYGRLGPYGYGYSQSKGGIGAGLDGEKEGSENLWRTSSPIDYRKVRWADAQNSCYRKNQHRFAPKPGYVGEKWRDMPPTIWGNATSVTGEEDSEIATGEQRLPRTAVVIRVWNKFEWTQEAIVYIRGLISEVSLLSGGEYHVHFLIHVKNDTLPIWSSDELYSQTLRDALPAEFFGMGTLWSERQMLLIYDGLQETLYRGLPVHGVYRSAHFPLQYFAHRHPEYDFFWNWEMDIRYTGNWYEFFESIRGFARQQARKGLWERSARFYVPSVHGSWEDFKQMVRVQSEMPPPQTNKWANVGPPGSSAPVAEPPVWGPLKPSDAPTFDTDPEPPTTYAKDRNEWGVGEEADLITLNPIFDPDHTGWILAEDVTGYNTTKTQPPRRTAIVTASRLSRRLLATMHRETGFHRHTMFSEMWPTSVALHHGLKAVYAPHPVFVDRAWPPSYLAKTFNNGFNGASGGARTSVFTDELQHNFLGVTFYYRAGFPANLWRRWLGFRVDNGGGEEEEIHGEGRMCLPPVLLHPILDSEFVVEEPTGDNPQDYTGLKIDR